MYIFFELCAPFLIESKQLQRDPAYARWYLLPESNSTSLTLYQHSSTSPMLHQARALWYHTQNENLLAGYLIMCCVQLTIASQCPSLASSQTFQSIKNCPTKGISISLLSVLSTGCDQLQFTLAIDPFMNDSVRLSNYSVGIFYNSEADILQEIYLEKNMVVKQPTNTLIPIINAFIISKYQYCFYQLLYVLNCYSSSYQLV